MGLDCGTQYQSSGPCSVPRMSEASYPRPAFLALAAALLAGLVGLAVAVHAGWTSGLDSDVASWLAAHESHRVYVAELAVFRHVGPGPVTVVGMASALLLAWWARSAVPAVAVIGAVGSAALGENAIKDLVARTPWTPAQLKSMRLPLNLDLAFLDQHSFPSGHVAGNAALLGMIAVCVGTGRSRRLKAVLAGAAVAYVLFVAFTAVYVRAHFFSDIIGGMLLGGLCVMLGAATLRFLMGDRKVLGGTLSASA